MKIKLSHCITLFETPDILTRKILSSFTLANPVYLANEKMGRWNGDTENYLYFYEQRSKTLIVPRGAMGLILYFCKELNIRFEIEDARRTLPQIDFTFTGTLKSYQDKAVKDILNRDFGVLQAPTGSGKTVIALNIIAERKQPCLIIVHSKELLHQWIERIETFLDIPRVETGIIGSGKMRIGDKITVGIINSIYPIVGDIRQHFGHIIVDECHRTPSRTFTEAVSAFDSQYMLGLSATPYRRDGLTKLINWYIGRKVEVKQTDLTEQDIILDVEVVTRATNFTPWSSASEEYSQMLSELTEDATRNGLIVADIAKEAKSNTGVCLVLSDRKSHCEIIYGLLREKRVPADVLTGDMNNKDRGLIVARLNQNDIKVLIATGQLIGEGFDCRGLSNLFLTTPIKFDGRLLQYMGRILRPAPGKKQAKVFDYIDVNVGVLRAAAQSRQRVYSRQKCNGK